MQTVEGGLERGEDLPRMKLFQGAALAPTALPEHNVPSAKVLGFAAVPVASAASEGTFPPNTNYIDFSLFGSLLKPVIVTQTSPFDWDLIQHRWGLVGVLTCPLTRNFLLPGRVQLHYCEDEPCGHQNTVKTCILKMW